MSQTNNSQPNKSHPNKTQPSVSLSVEKWVKDEKTGAELCQAPDKFSLVATPNSTQQKLGMPYFPKINHKTTNQNQNHLPKVSTFDFDPILKRKDFLRQPNPTPLSPGNLIWQDYVNNLGNINSNDLNTIDSY